MRHTVLARIAGSTVPNRWFTGFVSTATALMLVACSSASRLVDAPLEAIGLAKPVPQTAAAPPVHRVRLRIEAAANLNADDQGRGLALVARLYQLKNATRFAQLPYESFANAEADQAGWQDDVVSSRELILTPGQRVESLEVLAADTRHLGIVTLFRQPAPYRWRFVLDAAAAEQNGVLIGAHACAMTITAGLVGTDGAGRTLDRLPPACPKH